MTATTKLDATAEALKIVGEAFTIELRKLLEKLDCPSYRTYSLQFNVEVSKEAAKCFIELYNPSGPNIKAVTLGRLMDEAYHRFGFDDREKAAIDMQAIAFQPTDTDSE